MSMRSIYRSIAKKHGVSVAEVKREMQVAIAYAFQKEDKLEREQLLQKGIPCKKSIPSSEEFIVHIAKQIKEIS